MRIFVFEPFTGGGCLGKDRRVFCTSRADRIVRALLRDLSEVPGIDVETVRDARLEPITGAVTARYVRTPAQARSMWRRCIAASDAVWVVAPAACRLLERVSRHCIAAGRALLGSGIGAVGIAGSTRRTAEHLALQGIPVLPALAMADVRDWSTKWLLKPDDASAWNGIRIVASEAEAAAAARAGAGELIAQPYWSGTAVSLTLLCKNGRCRLLSTDLPRVVVVNDALFRLGEIVNGLAGQGARHLALAEKIATALPDLWGIVGIDLMVNDDTAWVLEITPSLTDSYPGLRDSIGRNPAALVTALLVSDESLSAPLDSVPVEVDFQLAFDELQRRGSTAD